MLLSPLKGRPARAGGQEGRISAVVVSYRTGAVLGACLEALSRQEEIAEIIVVDNGNPPAETALLDRLSAGSAILLLRPGRNTGFAAGCNLGAAQASAEFVSFVNPDLVVSPGSFSRILAVFAGRADVWLCGCRLLDMDGNEQRGGRREILTPWRAFVEVTRLDRLFPGHPHFRRFNLMGGPPLEEVEVPAISGAFMVMPRHRFRAMGGMDEAMFLHIEDVDLCLRVLKQGGRILYCGTVPVLHHGGTSDVSRLFVEWHKARSAVRYFFKHFSGIYPAWALVLVSALLWLRLGAIMATIVLGAGTAWRRQG